MLTKYQWLNMCRLLSSILKVSVNPDRGENGLKVGWLSSFKGHVCFRRQFRVLVACRVPYKCRRSSRHYSPDVTLPACAGSMADRRTQPITLPVEVWKEVADCMSTLEWARASGTCRAMFQVQPRRIVCQERWRHTPEHLLVMAQWCINHWREAEKIGIHFGDVHPCFLYELMIDVSPSEHLQQVAFDFSLSREAEGKYDSMGADKIAPLWLVPFLTQAQHMKALCLEGISGVLPDLPLLDKLVHLAVGLRRPLGKDACNALQTLQSLETLCLDVKFVSSQDNDAVEISGLDFTVCSKLRTVRLMMLEPEFLRLPPSCSLSVTRDILWMDESKWQARAGLISACSLRANAYNEVDVWEKYRCPALAMGPDLLWLSRFSCPHLTRLDLDYPKLSEVWRPIEINRNMANLQHLRISSLHVHLYITAQLRLQTLFLVAEQSLNLDIVNIFALAASLTNVQLSWVSCCPTTLKFAANGAALSRTCNLRNGLMNGAQKSASQWSTFIMMSA